MQHFARRKNNAAGLIQQAIQARHNRRASDEGRFLKLADPTIADGTNQRALHILKTVVASISAELHLLAEQFCHALDLSSIRFLATGDGLISGRRVHADVGSRREVFEQLLVDTVGGRGGINGHHVAYQVVHFSTCITGNESVREAKTRSNRASTSSLTNRRVATKHHVRHRTSRTASSGNQMTSGDYLLRQDIILSKLRHQRLLFFSQNSVLVSKRTNELCGFLKGRNLGRGRTGNIELLELTPYLIGSVLGAPSLFFLESTASSCAGSNAVDFVSHRCIKRRTGHLAGQLLASCLVNFLRLAVSLEGGVKFLQLRAEHTPQSEPERGHANLGNIDLAHATSNAEIVLSIKRDTDDFANIGARVIHIDSVVNPLSKRGVCGCLVGISTELRVLLDHLGAAQRGGKSTSQLALVAQTGSGCRSSLGW